MRGFPWLFGGINKFENYSNEWWDLVSFSGKTVRAKTIMFIDQRQPLPSTTKYGDDDEEYSLDPSIDLRRIESCYSRERKKWNRKSKNSKERSFDFILAAKRNKYKITRDGVIVQDQFLKALSGVLIVSKKVYSHVS